MDRRPLVGFHTEDLGARVAYSVKETAALLGVSGWAVKQAINDGRLEVRNVNERLVRIPAWSIAEFLGQPVAVAS